MNNYAGKPITGVQVFLEAEGNGAYHIVPINNPNAKGGQVGFIRDIVKVEDYIRSLEAYFRKNGLLIKVRL